MEEFKENHNKRVELANWVTKEQAINEAEIKALNIDNACLRDELKKSEDSAELAKLLLGSDENMGQYFRNSAMAIEKRAEGSVKVVSNFIDEAFKELKSVLELNSKLMIETKANLKSPSFGKRGEVVDHPLEPFYEAKFEKLKSRVSLLMLANLDLGQKVADSLIIEKRLKKELDNLKSQLTSESSQAQPGSSTRERLIREHQANIMSPEVDYLCHTLVDLQIKVDDAKDSLAKKQQEIDKLDRRHSELQQSITDLLAYESDLGYDRLKGFNREQGESEKKLAELGQRNSELEQIVKTLQFDQANKQIMIEKMSKESKLLLFLNQKLAEELNESNPESCSYVYSRQFFRKKKMVSGDEDLLLTVEEVYESDNRAKQRCFDLSQRLVAQADQINEQEQLIADRDCIIAELSKEIDLIKSKTNLLEKAEDKTEGEIYELIETLNSSIISGENSKLKEELRRVVDMNNSLNLAILDRDLEIAKKSRALKNLQDEMLIVSDLCNKNSTELMNVRSVELKKLKADQLVKKGEISTFQKINHLMKDRIEAANQNLKQVSSLFEATDKFEPIRIAPMVKALMEDIKGILSFSKIEKTTETEEMLTKLWKQREETLTFKIEALMAYNSVLSNKCRGLEQALEEYFSRIQQLERERANLEANSALEKIKAFMIKKEEDIARMTGKLDDMLSLQEETRRQEQEKWHKAVEQVRTAEREGRSQFQKIEKEMKDQVERVIEKCKSESQQVAQKCDALLQEKEEEINGLKSRLVGVEFEGRAEMIGQVEQLLSQNYQLRKEVAQLEAANKIHDINIDALEEINDATLKLSTSKIEDKLQKVTNAYNNTSSEMRKLEASVKEDRARWTARCSTLESSLGLSTKLFGELLSSLKSVPESDQLKAIIEAADQKLDEMQKLT